MSARHNHDVRRYIVSHFLAVISEWAALIGLLVYAFDRGGARAAGYSSLAALAPYLLLSSSTARQAQRVRPASVRLFSLAVQAVGYGIAAACALANAPLALAVAGVALAFTAVTALRPSGAVLLPALVRSSRELTTTNVLVGRCESVSVLLAPLVATGLLKLGGGGMVLAGSASLTALASLTATIGVSQGPSAAPSDEAEASSAIDAGVTRRIARMMAIPFADLVKLSRHKGVGGVLAAATGQYVILGALDIILVVVAGEYLDLGRAGAGILTTIFGAGAFFSIALAHHATSRPRLAPLMILAVGSIVAACFAFGASISLLTAIIVLPVLGCSRSLLDLMTRVLLQRSASPSQLASVFGALETCAGIGLLSGSLMAQALIAVSGARAALIGVGIAYAVLGIAIVRPLRLADDGADVPVVAMSLLRRLPLFAPLPASGLEAVARAAVEVSCEAGDVVIRQGEHGDRFYAVADGEFEVRASDVLVRTLGRGDGFGEVALLSDVPRTATVTAIQRGHLFAIERTPFLLAVTGYDSSRQTAWRVMQPMALDVSEPNG